MDTAKLFVTMRSPTTQLVVVSPDRMPINRNLLESSYQNKTVYQFVLMQRACKVTTRPRPKFGHASATRC